MKQELAELIESLRPILTRDGGDVRLDGYEESTHTVTLRYRKAAYHCAGANGAMRMLFERKIRQEFPMVQRVISLEENALSS